MKALLLVGGGFLSTSECHARLTDRYGQRGAALPCAERFQNLCYGLQLHAHGRINQETVPEEGIRRAPQFLPGTEIRTKIYKDRSPHLVATCSPALYKPGSSIPDGVMYSVSQTMVPKPLWKKGITVLVLNYFITTPWRRRKEWRCSSTIPDLSTRWCWVVSFTPRPLYPGERAPGNHWRGGWVSPRADLDAVEKRKTSCPCRELNPGSPACSPSLYWLSCPGSYPMGTGALSPGIKRSGREADHSPPSSSKVKNGGAIPPLPHMSSWHSA
jgi:hypothetical protein